MAVHRLLISDVTIEGISGTLTFCVLNIIVCRRGILQKEIIKIIGGRSPLIDAFYVTAKPVNGRPVLIISIIEGCCQTLHNVDGASQGKPVIVGIKLLGI